MACDNASAIGVGSTQASVRRSLMAGKRRANALLSKPTESLVFRQEREFASHRLLRGSRGELIQHAPNFVDFFLADFFF